MTGARIPTRSPRAAWSSPPDPDAEQARADVRTARAVLSAVARRVACRQEGAASLHAAQYRLDGALKALHRTIGHGTPPAPTDPDADPRPPDPRVNAARPSRPPPWPPTHYVLGADGPVVVVPGRVAAWLLRHAALREIRTRHRGIDPEVDACLVGLAVAAAAWRSSARGTGTRNQAEPEAHSGPMTTREAADELGCTTRGVRKAAAAGRLHAQRVGGRWVVTREDLAHYRAARAA